ncbi:MAG: polyprenyl synthetase family protein [bacterium]|nr:polyprenyl synthetase family protein [bacterium]
MNIEQKIKKFQNRFNKELGLYIDKKIKSSSKLSSITTETLRQLKVSLNGGKRLRPFLVDIGSRSGPKKVSNRDVLQVGMGIEVAHTSLLIHDDLIDNSSKRRGQPSYHVRANKIVKGRGRELAIVAGDYALVLMHELLNEVTSSPKQKHDAIKYLMDAFYLVGLGQAIDIALTDVRNIKRKNILELYEHKTAGYTVTAPLVAGAILAGASIKNQRSLAVYGMYTGIAFQIQDDMLDVFGSPKKTGKSLGRDISEGKPTLLFFEAVNRASVIDKKYLLSVHGKEIDSKALSCIKSIYKESGAYDVVSNYADELVLQAGRVLDRSNLSSKIKKDLCGLSEYIIRRAS